MRLDVALVRQRLVASRRRGQELVRLGRVLVDGVVATKPAAAVSDGAALHVVPDHAAPAYVSRGGHKLAGALAAFAPRGLQISGRRALDAGASTGGFTDVLLRAGAGHVVAADVGHGQLASLLRDHDRVTVLEGTNVRELSPGQLGEPVEVVVSDLSFISSCLVVAPLLAVTTAGADLVLMVKPQFEVGRELLGKGGVVRDPRLRTRAVLAVAAAGAEQGLGVRGVCVSPLPGPSGNVEYFLWLRRDAPEVDGDVVASVVRAGPQ